MSSTPIKERFAYHPPMTDAVIHAHEDVRALGYAAARMLEELIPPCHERDLAIDALDLAVMHANAAIARTQLRKEGA